MPEFVRVSLGTAIKLGLESGRVDENFTTAFLMTYHEGGCNANCAFCPQASSSSSNPALLSRIGWPRFSTREVSMGFAKNPDFRRVCIQCLNYPEVVDHALKLVSLSKKYTTAHISLSIHPISKADMKMLRAAGVDNIGIAIDACTPKVFDEIKGNFRSGPYSWKGHLSSIMEAQEVFGKSRVTTHLVVGLGETESEIADFLFDMKAMGVRVALFAFTPVKGTALESRRQPDLGTYRRVQILRDLLYRDKIDREDIRINDQGQISFNIPFEELRNSLSSGNAFRVTGCPGCNRPYYNERPGGTMYNYFRALSASEFERALEEAGLRG